MTTKKTHTKPDWVLKHKPKGTEVRLLNNTYYVYAVTSKWNPDKKRAQKITGKLLGKITLDGFIRSGKDILRDPVTVSVRSKEYGATTLCMQLLNKEIEKLKELFPEDWQAIFMLSVLRMVYRTHLKMVTFHLQQNYYCEAWEMKTTERYYSELLEKIGEEREKVVRFKKGFLSGKEFILVDSTHVLSESKELSINHPGYNNQHEYGPQVNLLFIFSAKMMTPVYYRLFAGNIREVKAFRLSLVESGITDAVIIADKGFYSEENIQLLLGEGLYFVIPLRRNNKMIDYTVFMKAGREGLSGYFTYQNRYIWYYEYEIEKQRLYVYLDEKAKVNEVHDYLARIETHPDEHSIEEFKERDKTFGTLALLTNVTDATAKNVYEYYKTRGQIEIMFDALKNILEADRTYMRKETSLEGWFFINFLAMKIYYALYQRLRSKNLLTKYSPNDIFQIAASIKKIYLNGKWYLSEIPNKYKKLFDSVELPIT